MPIENTPTILDYISAFGAIATPILVLILSGIGWVVSNRMEKARQLEEKLRQDRIDTYNAVLEPYILMFAKDEGLPKKYKGKTKEIVLNEIMLSLEYKQAAFKLSLIGSDEVFRAYSNLMQFFFTNDLKSDSTDETAKKNNQERTLEGMRLLGVLFLEIRKSVGNEKTTFEPFEMLEFLITDLRKLRKNGKY
jgi:hypothetical protein